MDPLALYKEACEQGAALSGNYHRNIRVEADSGPVVVRIRSGGTDAMDLTLWPEAQVLEAVGPWVASAPRLLYAGTNPEFQIHGFVAGRRVDSLAPEGKPLPETVVKGVEGLFGELSRVPRSALPAVPDDWPSDGDTRGFAGRLLDLVRTIRSRPDERVEETYRSLGSPEDPCRVLQDQVREVTGRRFGLLHADIHRQNMIVTEGGGLAFLDWELALWGDPVYELADHVHKMAYGAAERRAVTQGWERQTPDGYHHGWTADLDYYLAYEAVKSAVVDTVRWGRRIAEEQDTAGRLELARQLADKLSAAAPHWGSAASAVPRPVRSKNLCADGKPDRGVLPGAGWGSPA
ncbi:aminoglycoside phosphotransferase family protein [Streptomyces cirratus]